MTTILGFLIVTISVFGGFILEGGHFAVLVQPIELLIIGGAAFDPSSSTMKDTKAAQVHLILKRIREPL